MWVLINTAQFLVYIGMWQIKFPATTRTLLNEAKRLFLGEYFDDLNIGENLGHAIGIETDKSDNPGGEVGLDRLGSTSLASNFGVTFIVGGVIFVLLVVLILLSIFFSKRCNLSEKNKARRQRWK